MEEIPIEELPAITNASNQEIQPLSIEGPETMERLNRRRYLNGKVPGTNRIAMIGLTIIVLTFLSLVLVSFHDVNEENNNGKIINIDEQSSMQASSLPIELPTDNPAHFPTKSPTDLPTKSPTSNPTIKETVSDSEQKQQVVTKNDGVMYTQIGESLYHDKSHFIQGLTYSKSSDMLFESNGLYRESSICHLDPNTGQPVKCVEIEKNVFAEGMQVYGHGYDEKLIQITWKSRKGFIYNATTLERLQEFTFSTTRNEGWGICFDESRNEFIVSDGSNVLHFWDADTLNEIRTVSVYRQNGKPATNMNELEFVKGKVLSNVWFEDTLLVINTTTGECESEYDFSDLWPRHERQRFNADVLNGISISKDDGILYITGKKWNRMYKVKLLGF